MGEGRLSETRASKGRGRQNETDKKKRPPEKKQYEPHPFMTTSADPEYPDKYRKSMGSNTLPLLALGPGGDAVLH